MLKFSIRKNNSNNHWVPFIMRDIYLSPDMSFISGVTDSTELITSDSKILIKKKNDSSYNEYFVANVKKATISGKVTYYRRLPIMAISRVVDYFDKIANKYSTKTIEGQYVAYNDAVYYRYNHVVYQNGHAVTIDGFFINDRFYSAGTESDYIVIDETADIESDKVVIDGHEFMVFSDGESTEQWKLRYNDVSDALKDINGSGYTVNLNTDPSTHERVQKVVLYKSPSQTLEADDVKSGGYGYYVTVDDTAYKIKYDKNFDRYGITYNNVFYPVTEYHDSNPFTPYASLSGCTFSISGTSYDVAKNIDTGEIGIIYNGTFNRLTYVTGTSSSGYSVTINGFTHTGLKPISGISYNMHRLNVNRTSRCMPPFDNHVVRITDYEGENTTLTYKDERGREYIYGTVRKYTEYPVSQNLETDTSGDFLIMMTSDEHGCEIGDKIIAKSNGPVKTTLYLDNDEDGFYVLYHGKRYGTIYRGYDTININGVECRLIYDNSEYSRAHCDVDGDTLYFKVNNNVAKRTDSTFLKIVTDINTFSDYNAQDYSGSTYQNLREYISGEYEGEILEFNSGYTVNEAYGINIGTKYYKVDEISRISYSGNNITIDVNLTGYTESTIYAVTITEPEEYVFRIDDILGSGTFLLHSYTNNLLYSNKTVKTNLKAYKTDIADYEYRNEPDYECYYLYTGSKIQFNGCGYYLWEKYDENNERLPYYALTETLLQPGDADIDYPVSFIPLDEDGSDYCAIDSAECKPDVISDAFVEIVEYTAETGSTPNINNGPVYPVGMILSSNDDRSVAPPYHSEGVAAVAETWENYTFYVMDDVFGEGPVMAEDGLIKLEESNNPVSSWNINKIRTNLDMYRSVSYLNIALPLTTCVMPDLMSEDIRSNILVEEYENAHVNKIIDMEKIPFRLADGNNNIINKLSISPGDYDFDLTLNEQGIVPSNVKNSFIRMSFYDSYDSQRQELLGTMCLFFGGASIKGNDGTDGLIFENINNYDVYSVYDGSLRKSTSNEGLVLYAFKYNYDVLNEMTVYMKMEFNSAKTGRIMPLCPRRSGKVSLKEVQKALYFEYKLKYDDDNGYLFTPSERTIGDNTVCWETKMVDGVLSGILYCNQLNIKDESNLVTG